MEWKIEKIIDKNTSIFKDTINTSNQEGKVYERNPGIREHKEAGGGSGGRGEAWKQPALVWSFNRSPVERGAGGGI
jgi:hypothetical protein